MTVVVGIDVGGAHLKVARVDRRKVVACDQIACPLWQGADKLDVALSDAEKLTAGADRIAITMTGELSDLYENRQTGVASLVERMEAAFGSEALFWMGRGGFGSGDAAKAHHEDVGSANFLATAEVVAQHRPNAIVIDMGSTTTDIVPIAGGKPLISGFTDATRLETGELVYTGLVRTAVMSVVERVPINGQWQTIAREYFATMADIYRILVELREGVDVHATADGRGKTHKESVDRFARMFGRDGSDNVDWHAAALYVRDRQIQSVCEGLHQVQSNVTWKVEPSLVAAGIGAELVANHIAPRMGYIPEAFSQLIDDTDGWPLISPMTRHATAVSVALLETR